MRSTILIALAGIAVINAVPVRAETVVPSAPTALDPARGYVLVRLGERSPGLWNVLTLSPYDAAAQDVRGKGRAKGSPLPKGADGDVRIGPKSFIAEDAHVRTYLVAITPGRYVIFSSPTTCFCLGSYQFDVAPGRITDLGTIHIGPENGSSPWARLRSIRSSVDIEDRPYTVADAMAVLPSQDDTAVPAALRAFPRDVANYSPAPRFGNHNGQLLNRALPLEPGS